MSATAAPRQAARAAPAPRAGAAVQRPPVGHAAAGIGPRTSLARDFGALPPFARGRVSPPPRVGPVRIHADGTAERLTTAHSARALTVGDDVYVAPRLFRLDRERGRRLIAHELAHVAQLRLGGADGGVAAAEEEAERIAAGTATIAPHIRAVATATHPLRSAQTIIDIFEDELDDVFFGIDNAWPAIRKEPQAERDKVRADKQLERRVAKRASPKELLSTYLLLQYQTEDHFPPHYKTFIAATYRWGTHEEQVYTVLRGVTSAQRAELRDMPGFRAVIVEEMSGGELRKALRLLDEGIEQEGQALTTALPATHMETVERYALDVGISSDNLDEAIEQVTAAVDAEGQRIVDDISVWAAAADHFDLEELWYLRMIARAGSKANLRRLPTETKPYVETIWWAVKGWGTKERPLIEELGHVAAVPAEKPILVGEQTFVPMLEDELSGDDLRDAFAAIGVGGLKRPSIYPALMRAIGHRDGATINKLLADPNLPPADLAELRFDVKVIAAIADKLRGWQLCETVLLLKYGWVAFPPPVAGILAPFKKHPVDVAGAEAFLNGLTDAEKDALLFEPGIYFMLTNSGLSGAAEAKLLAAIRPGVPVGPGQPGADYRVPGSEGRFRAHRESVRATLPVEFTAAEIRVVVRANLDKSKMRDRGKLGSGTLEDWSQAVDEIWNGRFVLRSGPRVFPLVFVLYMAEGVVSPNTVHVFDWKDRSFRRGHDLFLFLEDLEPKVVAHEFGHMLGYPDEYALPPGEYERLTGEKSTEPQKDVPALMGAHYKSTKVELRYAGPATEAVNAVRDTTKYPAPFALERKK